MTEIKEAAIIYSEEEQRHNREELIPRVKAVLEVKSKIQEFQFIFYALVATGFFLGIGHFISEWFSVIIGLFLFGGGLFFSKKQNDYLAYLKDKYGV